MGLLFASSNSAKEPSVSKHTLAAVHAPTQQPALLESLGLQSSLLKSYPDVLGEYLQIPGVDVRNTPVALNTVTFLRLRAAMDGDNPKPAHAVLLAIPDIGTGAAYWLPMSAQLIRKAQTRQCHDHHIVSQCRIEVWVVLPRSANLIDSRGVRLARAERTPISAIDYYFGRQVLQLDPQRLGKWPIVSQQQLIRDSKWRPFSQMDLPFMAEWGFETAALDLDRVIARIGEPSGGKNVFLAGLGAGGDFALAYAAYRQANGRRGFESLAGLILLDTDGTSVSQQAPTPTQLNEYFDRVDKMRRGLRPVFTEDDNAALLPSGPIAAATQAIAHAYYALAQPSGESIFPAPSVRHSPLSPKGNEFIASLRLTLLAHAGMSVDANPLPKFALLQASPTNLQGATVGHLNWNPNVNTGTCVPKSEPCLPMLTNADRHRILDWVDTDTKEGRAPATTIGKAALWIDALGFSPARSNITEIDVAFRQSGKKTIDASALTAKEWYASERYAADLRFMRHFKSMRIHDLNVDIDLDHGAIVNLPLYAAATDAGTSPQYALPLVTDYTQINRAGVYQSGVAKSIQPLDASINTQLYHHADFTSADDSASPTKPGEPGTALVSNTLLDWILMRSKYAARVPTPNQLGVKTLY